MEGEEEEEEEGKEPSILFFPVGEVNTLFFKIFNIIISVYVRDMRNRPFRHHLGTQNTQKHLKTIFFFLRMAFNNFG